MKKSDKPSTLTRLSRAFPTAAALLILFFHLHARAVGTGTLDQVSGWFPLGTNLTVHATPGVGSIFAGWLGSTNGATMISNQITFSLNSSLTITGLFSTAQIPLTVASSHGTPNPNGTVTNAYGTLISAYIPSPIANGTTQYLATGWTGTGSTSGGNGTNAAFMLTNNTTLTWLWQTNYLLASGAGSNGTITPNGTMFASQGSNQSFTITPNANYSIAAVSVDGTNIGSASLYTFTNLTGSHTIQASFVIRQFTLTVVSAQGVPTPAGTSTNPYAALISAFVTSPVTNGTTQYVATGWVGSGSASNGTGTNTSFTITNNTTLTWLWQTNVWVNLNVIGN